MSLQHAGSFLFLLGMQTQKKEQAVTYCNPVVWNDSDIKLSPVLIDNKPHFVAVEICALLDLTNPTKSLKSLDEDEKLSYPIVRAGQQRVVNLVNESGLYHLIFLSRKPQAAAFRKWVTSEVLPALRRTGRYELTVSESEISVKMVSPRRWSQRYVRPTAWLDLRMEPYTQKMLNGYPVRVISFEDIEWYSVADILRSMQVATSTYQTAAALNASDRELARKIYIFGNTHPAWFTTITGLKLIKSSSRSQKSNNITGRL